MSVFHVNPKTGRPGRCRASKECPFGGVNEHYPTKEAAQEAYESKMKDHEVRTYSSVRKRNSIKDTKLSAVMNTELLKKMIEENYVTVASHPEDESMKILTYSKNAQISGKWNEVTKAARGLIIKSENEDFSDAIIVERPWRKFFTLEQMTSSDGKRAWALGDEDDGPENGQLESIDNLDFNAPAEVTDKADGSLGVLYVAPDGKLALSTKGSFVSEQAIAYTSMLRNDSRFYDAAKELKDKNPNTTFLFELVGAENQVVLEYDDDDITFLGAVDKDTGKYHSTSDYTDVWSKEKSLNSAEKMDAKNIEEALAIPDRPNREGVVVRIASDDPEKQMMLKIKQADYLKLHKMMTSFNKKIKISTIRESNPTLETIIEVSKTRDITKIKGVEDAVKPLREGKSKFHERLYSGVMNDFNNAILPVADDIVATKEYVDSLPEKMFKGDDREIKKNFALSIKDKPRDQQGYLFIFFKARLSGESISNSQVSSFMERMAKNI